MMKHVIVVSVVLVLFSIPLSAQPVHWTLESGGNGHYYEFVSMPGVGFGHALGHADARVWDGWPGYLATITSQEESDFITSALAIPDSAWIGASVWPWRWVTQEPWVYENWCPGEPDDAYPGNYSCAAQIMSSGCWRDCLADSRSSGFVVEYGGYIPVPVDESTWGRIKALYQY
jgi:hypothetical protein